MPRTVLVIACLVLAAVAPGCGGSADDSSASDEMTVEEPTSESTTDDVDCRVPADAAPVMYVGWSIWEELGLGEDSEDAKFPDEIKADVETLAEALVERSGYYSDAYAGEDLGFPPDDLGIPPGSVTDRQRNRGLLLGERVHRSGGAHAPSSRGLGPGELPPIPLKRGVAVAVCYLSEGTPSLRDVAKVTASLATRERL